MTKQKKLSKLLADVLHYLENAEKGQYAEYNGRIVCVENACGGKYLKSRLIHDSVGTHEEISGLVDDAKVAAEFLVYG